MKQAGLGVDDDSLCIPHTATFDPAPYANASAMRGIVRAYRDSRLADPPYPHHAAPVLATACSKVARSWDPQLLPGWNAGWMLRGPRGCHGGLRVRGGVQVLWGNGDDGATAARPAEQAGVGAGVGWSGAGDVGYCGGDVLGGAAAASADKG